MDGLSQNILESKFKMVSVSLVAKKAGVSIATASRTLRDPMNLRTANQRRIIKIAKEFNYDFALVDENVAKTKQILFLSFKNSLTDTSLRIMSPMIVDGIEEPFSKLGYNLLVANVKDDEVPRCLLKNEVDGIIFHGRTSLEFYQNHIQRFPHVGIQHYNPLLNSSWVKTDNENISFQAIWHLHECGHRRIAFLASDMENRQTWERLAGYRAAMKFFGLKLDPRWEIVSEIGRREGYPYDNDLETLDFLPFLKPLVENAKPLTAIYCSDNFHARLAMDSLAKLGMKVPDDISMVGIACELLLMDQRFFTCVCDKFQEVCSSAASLLIDIISGKQKKPLTILVRPELFIKNSVKKINASE